MDTQPLPGSAEPRYSALHTLRAATVLAAHGTEREVGGDTPLLLNGDYCWFVLSGRVEVFVIPMINGRPGRRTHLFAVDAGNPLFGLEGAAPDGRTLLGVGAPGTRLLELHRSAVQALSHQAEHTALIATLIDTWVEAVCSGIAQDVKPTRCTELVPNERASLPAATFVRSQPSVGWVTHLEGKSLLLGDPLLVVNGRGYTPLSRRLWLELREPGQILLVSSDAITDVDVLWDGLAQLHQLVLRCVEQMNVRAEKSLRDRLRLKASVDAATLRAACGRLVATIQPSDALTRMQRTVTPVEATSAPTSYDTLVTACQIVGSALDIAIRRPPTSDGAPPPRDALAGIMRASRIRSRKVVLRGRWWEHDHGPLLGTATDEQRAVALIRSNGSYMLHDPFDRRETPLTPEVAETLQPFGYTFYRPFPDSALGIKDVLKFGLFGSKRDIITMIAVGLVSAVLSMVPSIATGMLFNHVIPGAQRSQLLQITVVLIVCSITTISFNLARGIALLRIEGRMGAAVQAAVWDRLLSLPLPFFRPYTSGDLAVRAMSIDAIRQAISGSTVAAILGGIFSIGNFGLMFYYSPTMAWRATLLITVALAVTATGILLQLRPQRGVLTMQTKVSGLMLQLLSSVGKLRVAGAETKAFGLWAERFSEQRALQYQSRRIGIRVQSFHALFPIVASLFLFWSAVALLGTEGGPRTGDFLAFLAAFTACSGALLSTFAALLSTLNVIPQYELAKPIMHARPEVDQGKADPGILTGDIGLQHVMFRYQADGPLVLRDLTLQIEPGKFVALVGPSGSGKSTILRLLLGFEKPEAGAIFFDGQELAGLDIQAVRRQLGVVLQSGRLMGGDIFSNIAGASTLTVEEAWEAARMAGFAADIEAMPMGMHTVIGDSGGTLSGGQRQRLLIARAIVHRPRILLFDEATSALDNHTQAIVSRSLEQLQATRIVVAHRLSTIRNADRIYVVNHGRIEEQGTYDELMRHGALFKALANRQMA